ncbi:hypothetical protein ABB37_03872 [Leptomonas pyrrhocoris]|uniref:Uncharacterized protein n=1 Tax=Leptomonas pyrrhocoris TaxID=157538 RepID=A0A0N0VFS7_LEPPY|nr:hypothetical protein ABB37_03872 [Leptomonas pyrrhocoris]KPA81524.1 hypothetical protein ABB37_03872 [Leptomonas pyrrhocoris]|eukprot:XP_015659963.1 hypothetical protein ABB37_03872 [Leptomonas pyrrhocoris]
MFSCVHMSKVKLARTRKPKTLTEQHKAELRARRKAETAAAHPSQRPFTSSMDSLPSDGEDNVAGCYVYKNRDPSHSCSAVVHSTRPPPRAKSLEECRPPPLVITAGGR